MSRLPWREGKTFTLRVKGDVWIPGQMLVSPYLLFFNCFDEPPSTKQVLFCCAVTRQFLKFADMKRADFPAIDYQIPIRWIENHHGSRKLIVWPGTPRERTVLLLSSKPGGRLTECLNRATFYRTEDCSSRDIALDDNDAIDRYERADLWTFPLLNERLTLCRQLGRNVDPGKDIMFGRSLPAAYETYVDILAGVGELADWGYEDYCAG